MDLPVPDADYTKDTKPVEPIEGDLDDTIKENDALGDAVILDTADDNALQQAIADASGGSDTDVSKQESGAALGGKHHVRSNSVKKPTSFKAVSVTRNFLAKAAGSTPTSKTVADKCMSDAYPTHAQQ